MVDFWWHGRGYLTILIWLATLCVFGIVAAAGRSFIPDRAWYWGLAFVAAAAVNWHKGTQLNASSLRKHQPKNLWQRFFYRARHRFMSMPMETFSLVFVVAGIALALHGALAPATR